jgi:DnaK suppressor protein
MDKSARERIRRQLEEEQRDLESLLARTEAAGREADQAFPEDVADKAANSYTKEFLFSQSNSGRSHLQHVNAAIGRLKNGSFGICEECGEPIEPKRIEAVPWTPFCRACQEEEERNAKINAGSGVS